MQICPNFAILPNKLLIKEKKTSLFFLFFAILIILDNKNSLTFSFCKQDEYIYCKICQTLKKVHKILPLQPEKTDCKTAQQSFASFSLFVHSGSLRKIYNTVA